MDAIIETRDLTRRFGELTAVDHLNLSVATGAFYKIVGPDGAGKTNTLRMLYRAWQFDEPEWPEW